MSTRPWQAGAPGVMRLPSGDLVRGRGLRNHLPDGPVPTFGLYVLGKPPPAMSWEVQWIRWPDFWLPTDPAALSLALHRVRDRCSSERVEIACRGGHGRTGTALACLAIIDGVAPTDAVEYVRAHYDRRAVETPWQRRFVKRFA